VLGTLTLAGCSSEQSGTTPVYDPVTRELARIDYDYNADGVIDVRTYMRAGKPQRLEGDADADGRVDRWEYYDHRGEIERVGASSQQDGTEDTWISRSGGETRMEISTQRDGRVDRREFYRGDVLLRAESDTDRDGRFDSWEAFENGRLASVAVDEDRHAGRPTRRLNYAEGGSVGVEIDPDGDGRFEPATPAGGAIR
jgi:hypothetical protein